MQDPSGPTPDGDEAASGVGESKGDEEQGGEEEEEEEMVDPKEKFEEGRSLDVIFTRTILFLRV